jgi:hypothetical protein
MGWACSTIRKNASAHRVLVGRSGGKKPLRRLRQRWEDMIVDI